MYKNVGDQQKTAKKPLHLNQKSMALHNFAVTKKEKEKWKSVQRSPFIKSYH